MFGQMGLLTGRRRRADGRAIAPSTLLVLDEARFRRLLGRSPALRAAVRESAATRGVNLGDILEAPAAG